MEIVLFDLKKTVVFLLALSFSFSVLGEGNKKKYENEWDEFENYTAFYSYLDNYGFTKKSDMCNCFNGKYSLLW